MGILVYRDRDGFPDLMGRIDYQALKSGVLHYDERYLKKARANKELGVSLTLPLDERGYSAQEFQAFFSGLLPEGEVYQKISELYQVPQSDYLALLEQLGCESIGALTFVSEKVDPEEYQPYYRQVTESDIENIKQSPVGMAARTAQSTRLSLAGAQSKVAWYLKPGATGESITDWEIPYGTAPSTHIVKISRRGEEELALNEHVCSILALSCGIETAKTQLIPEIPGALLVERYDRIRPELSNPQANNLAVRLHQEDFCQALGLNPYFKYQPNGTDANYPGMMADLIEDALPNPSQEKAELMKRLVFTYLIGNSDAHLKNFSLLYNQAWTRRRLAPLYDLTCIPLTGYTTRMPFVMGDHREISEIDAYDWILVASDMGVSLDMMDEAVRKLINTFEAPINSQSDERVEMMLIRIIANAESRLEVMRSLLGIGK